MILYVRTCGAWDANQSCQAIRLWARVPSNTTTHCDTKRFLLRLVSPSFTYPLQTCLITTDVVIGLVLGKLP
jgi:hypothetical protein